MPAAPATGNGIATADVDGDGDLDVVVAVATGYQVFLQADGALTPGIVIPTTATTGGSLLVAADMDGDGDTDLVLTGFADTAARVAVNDGTGGFTLGPPVPTGVARLAVGDVTGDGLPDVVTQDAVFAQEPGGGFAAAAPLPHLASASHVAVADVTGDGRADVVRTDVSDVIHTSPQLATGGFGALRSSAAGTNAEALVLADIDGDGRTDALVNNQRLRRPCTCSGSGPTAPSGARSASPRTPRQATYQEGAFRVADLDGDGLLDLVQTPNTPDATALVVQRRLPLTSDDAVRGWVDAASLAPHTAGVALRPTVTVVTGRPLAPESVTTTSVRLIDGQSGDRVTAQVTYTAATRTVEPDPDGRT